MDSELTGTLLNGMLWTTIKFDQSHHPLLTGDRPIVMTDGLNRPNSHIVMPISPRMLFVAANNESQITYLRNVAESGGLSQIMNNRIARQARKYVYATDDRPLQFIAQRLGEKAPWSPFE